MLPKARVKLDVILKRTIKLPNYIAGIKHWVRPQKPPINCVSCAVVNLEVKA
jgi:hypothetical protein